MKTDHYFESIGVWPHEGRRLARTYVYGFVLSLALTVGAYAVAVQHLVTPVWVVPIVLIFACLQFMVQVLNFLHVSGAPSSRERLVILGCAGVIMFILVLGSMWIMTNLDSRMHDATHMETYMQHEAGI